MLEDKLYESDYFNIYVCQTYRTKYNKIKEEYHKELCIYLDFYYEDSRPCKIVKYEWDGEGKWSYISDITIRFADGEVMEHVSGYYLYLTEESLEKYGWYFKEDDY